MKGQKSQLSGNRDTDREILSKVDDKELLKVCSIDKNTWNNVCDENFLKRRLAKYPEIEIYKSVDESWKQFFLRSINYITLMKEKFEYSYTFGDFDKQYDLLKKYIEYNRNINVLLFYSAEAGELSLVIWSLEKGANDLSLREPCRKGYLEIVRYLVEHGANIHALDVLVASMKGKLEIVQYLFEKGANIHSDSDLALRYAIEYGHVKVVKYLVEHGANINANNDEALKIAIKRKHLEIVKYLKSKM